MSSENLEKHLSLTLSSFRSMQPSVLAATLILIAPPVVRAQNLVPNGSLEEYTTCPDNGNQMNRAIGWSTYRGTPDYLNLCDTIGIASVPLNFAGNRYAADGDAYAAIIAWETGGPPNQREYFGAALSVPLIPGMPIFLAFKVIMATGGLQDDCRWSVNGVGIRFAMNSYFENNNFPSPNQAAIHLTAAPLDTVRWTTVSGMYVPDSAYRYIVLGNFFDDGLITPVQFNPNGNINRAFAFIDDICVSHYPDDCGIETNLHERSRTHFYTSPNPFSTDIRVSLSGPVDSDMDVWMRDFLGRTVWTGRIQSGRTSFTIDGSHLPEGLYVISGESSTEVLPATVVVRVSP